MRTSRRSRATATMSVMSVLLAGLTIPACVTENDYQDLAKQADASRTELEHARSETDALEQQLVALEKEVATLTSRSKALSSELQKLRETQTQEQLAFDEAVGRMHQAAITLKAQNRTLRQDFEQQQKENIALAALVQRYSRELEESQPAPPPPAPMATPAVVQIPAPAVQTNGVAHPPDGIARPAAPPAPKPAVVPAQQPADEGWFAYIMSWLLALWHLIF
jgi:hypothetical protein